MMRDAHYGVIGAIAATDQNRLWRNLSDGLSAMAKLRDWGVDVIFYNQGIDTTTSMGKMLFALTAAFGQFESDSVSERTKRTLGLKKLRGEKGPGLRPFGWSIDSAGIMTRNQKEQGFADLIGKKRANGATWGRAAKYANDLGVPTVLGNEWSEQGLRLVMGAVERRRQEEAEILIV